jgi:hypothetical protein
VHAVAIMADPFDSDDDISTAFGPETLAERDIVPEGFNSTPRPSPSVPICAQVRQFQRYGTTASNIV